MQTEDESSASQNGGQNVCLSNGTLWCQFEDMSQLIVTPQGIEKVTIQLKDAPNRYM